jgi:hypothetical protein
MNILASTLKTVASQEVTKAELQTDDPEENEGQNILSENVLMNQELLQKHSRNLATKKLTQCASPANLPSL